MSKSTPRKKRPPKRVLALPDLEHAKAAVLNSRTSQRSANLRPRDSRVRCVVLFGAPPCVQSYRRAPVPDSPRTTQICAGHDQSSTRCGSVDRVRGSRRRSTESRAGVRYPSGEGRPTDRCAPRELANPRAGPATSGVRDAVDGARATGSRDGRHVDWVRSASRRAVGAEPRVNPATRRALVIADLVGKGDHVRTVPIPTWVKRTVGRVDGHGVYLIRPSIPGDQ